MSTELMRIEADQQLEVIRKIVAPKGTTDAELKLFLMYCQRTGLDPIGRQIWFSERRAKDPQTGQWIVTRVPETTIDGFRITAERSGEYQGQTAPQWCGADGVWRDAWLEAGPPAAARVGIWRDKFREPLYAVALYREYVQLKSDGTTTQMWQKMPAGQLAKCAEALALRKSFPRDLSGLYAREEMEQATTAADAAKEVAAEKIEKLRAEVVPQIEAGAEIVDPAPKKTKKNTDFEMLKHFQEMKREIGEDAYYSVLNRFNFNKSDEITDRETARKVYVAMGHERARIKAEGEIMATLKHAGEVIGVANLIKILGAHGAECPEDVAGMQPEAQAAALEAVNVAVKERVTHEEN